MFNSIQKQNDCNLYFISIHETNKANGGGFTKLCYNTSLRCYI
jgi:hypothetical protein